MHIEVVISHSVSEWQSDESGEFAIFFTKSVAMATSLEISKLESLALANMARDSSPAWPRKQHGEQHGGRNAR